MLDELSLKDSELRYRRLFESAQDGILILDAQTGMIEDVNPYLIKMLGYSREEFLEKKLWEVGAFKDVEASKDAFEALQDREYMRYEGLPLKTKDGRLIQVEFVSNVYLAGGEKIIQCNIRDITEHKRIIVELQANEKKYFGLLNQSSDGIFIIDLLGNIRTVNTAMCRELEFSQEEFLSMKIWDIFPKEYVDQYRERLTQILAGERFEEPGEYEVRGKNGKYHYVEILSTPHYSGRDIVGFQGIARDITGRKQLQEKLRGSEKKYRELVEMTHDLVWAVDVEGRITYMSPASRSIYGREPEEMIGHLYTNFVPPDQAKRGMAELASALATGAPTLEAENRVNHQDGHEVVLSANAQVQRDAAGNIVGMVGTSRDITTRKMAEEALQASEARNRKLIEHLPTVVYMNAVGDASSTLYVSPQIETLLGYTPQEWLADPKLWSKTLHPEDSQHVLTRTQRTDLSNEPFEMEYRMIARDGRLVWVHDQIVLVNDLEGNPQFWQGIMLNITERKQAESALFESREQFSNAFQYSAIGMALLSLEGRWLKVNPMLCSIVGYSEGELLTRTFQDLTHSDELARDIHGREQMLAGEIKSYKMEKRYFHKNGEVVWVYLALSLARDKAGRPLHFISQVEDITERKVAEESLRKSDLLLRATGKMAKVGGWEFDVATTTLVWMEEVYEIHGVGPDYEPAITKWINLFASEAIPVLAQAMQRAIDHGKPFDLELPIFTGQEKRRWVHIMSQAQQSNGRTTKLSGVFQDITERKLAEEALRESESSLQGILSSTADGILAVSKENKILFANERFIEMWRIPQAVLATKDDSLLLQYVLDQLSDPQAFLKMVQDLYKSREESFDTLYFKDGRVFERISHPLIREQISHPLLQKTELRGRVWSFRDVTHRKQAEEALRTSEERLRQVWEATSDAMGLSDPEGIMLAANPAYLELYGYTREQVIGKSFSAIFPEGSREQAVEQYRKVFASELIAPSFESVIQRSDGTGRTVEANATFLNTNGLRTAMLSTMRDITMSKHAEKKIQQQLQHLTALRAIDQVIAANFDLKLSLSEILTHVIMELEVDAADILLLNSSSQMLEYGAQCGFRTRAIKKLPMRLSSSYAGRVILGRKSIQIQNPGDGQENLFPGTPLEGEDFVFYSCVPLITKGQIKGVLEVFHRTALEPDAEWLNFLHNLASQAAIAIENAVLFESLQRSNLELSMAYDATIEGWSRALDLRDKETEGHTQRVTEMTQKLARAFGVVEAELLQIRWGSLLHDIGKMGIPDGILLKPAALTDEEWVMMKKHPVFAYEMLSPIRYLQQSLDIPYCHHEKWDGTGYPRGLKGDMIPLSARIFAVVDVWDALCSDRPYRPGWPEEKVRAHIRALSGTHFDPQVVDVFMQSLN